MIIKAYNDWRTYRRTLNDLNSLSESSLKDIGISRCDIHRIARNTGRR